MVMPLFQKHYKKILFFIFFGGKLAIIHGHKDNFYNILKNKSIAYPCEMASSNKWSHISITVTNV